MISKVTTPYENLNLQENRLFAGIPAELLSEIGSDLDLLRFDKDDVIFEEGEPGDCLYLVCEGSIRISKLGRGGKQETLGFIQPGNFFGEMALIDGQPRSAQASAVETTVLCKVDHASFDRILACTSREVMMNFLRSVVERLRGTNSHYITELMRSERLSLVGGMSNSIVHDLKTPLQAILSCTELITSKCSDPVIGRFVGIIKRAVDNMTDMTQELLDFARGQSSLQLEVASCGQVIGELENQLMQVIPAHIHFEREIEPTGEVLVDSGRFARMLLNLVKNAVEAMPKGGILWLRVRERNGQVIFNVSDTGCGIDAELQKRIFEPFVTFGKSKGTGLGMAIVKSVAEAHHGTIQLTSEIGVGTSVEISVPRHYTATTAAA